MKRLKHKTQLFAPKSCQFVVAKIRKIYTVQEYASCIRLLEPGDHVKQCGLANTRLPRYRNVVTRSNIKVNRLQDPARTRSRKCLRNVT